MPISSGISEETRMIAMPCAARSEIMPWTSAFDCTSIPCVGSSRIRSVGAVASHFARTTFCWLPPESEDTGWA